MTAWHARQTLVSVVQAEMANGLRDPVRWRRRALHARMLADALHEPQVKLRMLEVAESCEWLAQLAEDRMWRIAKRQPNTRSQPGEVAAGTA
jgi:hypothetical protein